jgi:hypothetical protein
MSQEAQGPIPVERVGIPVPADQVTPEMRMHAIGSPERVGAGVLRTPEELAVIAKRAEGLGQTVAGSAVEVDTANLGVPTTEQGTAGPFMAESTDVRPAKPAVPGGTSLRPGYFKAATPQQVENARRLGFDLAAGNAKYHPYSSAKQ